MPRSSIAYKGLIQEFRSEGNREIAEHSSRFFKAGKGEYGEGDQFLGIRVPVVRKHARKFKNVSLAFVQKLLRSKIHEERFLAVIPLVEKFKSGSDED